MEERSARKSDEMGAIELGATPCNRDSYLQHTGFDRRIHCDTDTKRRRHRLAA